IRSWVLKDKKKGIRISIRLKAQTVAKDNFSIFRPSSKSSSKRKSETEKRRAQECTHRELDKRLGQYVTQIIKANKCVAGTYQNNAFPYILVSEEYIKLNHQ